MCALGRFLPVAILSPDRLVIGESGPSEIGVTGVVTDGKRPEADIPYASVGVLP